MNSFLRLRVLAMFGMAALALCSLVSFPSHALAQGIVTGSITATVVDSTGGLIAGAQAVATNVGTGTEYKGKATSDGVINLKELPIGPYTLVVTSEGFSKSTLSGIVVQAGSSASVGVVKLSIGATESVTVETAKAIFETSQSQLTTTFDSQAITDLPTGGGLDRLTLLVPGVVRTLANNNANTNGVGFSSNGQRGRSNNFELDGQSNNDNSVSGPQFFFHNEDAIQEVQVITNNFGAQYGRNAGSVVNYITKNGTNAFHGAAFENYVGSWGSSLTQGQKDPLFGFCAPGKVPPGCTIPAVPRVTANEYGGAVGGPILKDRLFFFGSTLWRKVTNGASPSISTALTPTPNGLKQLQAAFPNNPFVTSLTSQGPYSITTGSPTSVSSAVSNPTVCAAAVTVCPAGSPTVEVSTIQRFLPSTSSDKEHLGRIDYQFTPKDRFFLRYLYQNAPTFVSGGTISTGAYFNTFNITHSVGADITHTFSSRWVNQLRYSFQQSKLVFGGGGYSTCVNATISNCPSSVSIGGYSGYGIQNNIPQGRTVKVTQVQDNANWTIGRHAITFGGEWDYQNSPNTFLPNTSGTFSFTNFNYALAGNGSLSLANGNPTIPFNEPDVAAYLQDDWKVSPSLTLNLGLRWEFFKQGINVLHDQSLARQTGPNPIWDKTLPLSLTTFPYIPENYKNFQPRIGFAFNPMTLPALVLRGGFAINYDPQFYNIFLNAYTSAPVVNTGVINCNGTTFNCLPSGGTINSLVHAQNDQYNPTGVNPGTKTQSTVGANFHNPYTENYTLGIEYQLNRFAVGEVRYVGNHSVAQFQNLNGNPSVNLAPPASSVPAAQNYKTLAQAFPNKFPASSYCTTAGAIGLGKVDCTRTYVSTRANTSYSIYNALQTKLSTRNFHGVSGTAAYTWSRTIDNASEIYSTNGGGTTISTAQNPFDTSVAERGVSGQSYPHVTSLGLVFTPTLYAKQSGLVGRLLGGFSFNTIYTFNSGQPYTPYQPSKQLPTAAALAKIPTSNQGQSLYSFCDYYYNTGVLGVDSCRPILSSATAPIGSVGINGGPGVGYLDFATGASISPTAVHWLVNNQYEAEARGNPFPGVGRNTLRGNTVNELDMSVFKTVKIRESVSAQLRINIFNVPNRAYYGTPDALISNADPLKHTPNYASFTNYQANGGTIVGTAFGKGVRNIELGGKIIF